MKKFFRRCLNVVKWVCFIDISPNQKRWCNDRYHGRQGYWRGVEWEHDQMAARFKEVFGSELTPFPRYSDNPPKPPFPEYE